MYIFIYWGGVSILNIVSLNCFFLFSFHPQFFSQESGAMLSRAEFDTMMDTHTEITEYTTVSIIRQMSDTVCAECKE